MRGLLFSGRAPPQLCFIMRAALKHLKKDPVLAGILKQAGPFAMQYRDPTFDTLVRSIVSQQLSGRVASVIFGRLLAAVSKAHRPPGRHLIEEEHLPKCRLGEPDHGRRPQQSLSQLSSTRVCASGHACSSAELTPAAIMKLRIPRMRKLGLSAQKTLYIRELAKHTRKGTVVFETLPGMADADVIQHLTQVKGIGVWTAQIFLMFALRREDVLPVADLGIRSAMKKAWALPDLPKPPEMEQIAAAWRPYRSIASWYLWRYLDGPAEL